MNFDRLRSMAMVSAVVLCSAMSVYAAPVDVVRHVSGEITWVDLTLGKLELKNDAAQAKGEISEYRITANETRVTDPADKKMLTVEDLQPGLHVTIDVVNGKEGRVVEKITADPRPSSAYQEIYGKVEVVDAAGTLTLASRPLGVESARIDHNEFLFDPDKLVVMQSPSTAPVRLQLKPGDVVKIEFIAKDGKYWAQSITVYGPKVTSTTTTTTVTTTE